MLLGKFSSKPHFLPHFFFFFNLGKKHSNFNKITPQKKVQPNNEVPCYRYIYLLSHNWYSAVRERIHIPVTRYIFPNQRGQKELKPCYEASNLVVSFFVSTFLFFFEKIVSILYFTNYNLSHIYFTFLKYLSILFLSQFFLECIFLTLMVDSPNYIHCKIYHKYERQGLEFSAISRVLH